MYTYKNVVACTSSVIRRSHPLADTRMDDDACREVKFTTNHGGSVHSLPNYSTLLYCLCQVYCRQSTYQLVNTTVLPLKKKYLALRV